MTDAKLTISQEKAGALTRPVPRWGSDHEIDHSLELILMFSQHDGDVILHMCREAGFPKYPEVVAEPLETLAIRYTGAAPSIADPKDLAASKCWLMIHFASAHDDYLRALERGDVIAAMGDSFMLGRLTEWWRFRSLGHDAEAVAKQSQNTSLYDAREKRNKDRTDAAAEWHEQAYELVDEILDWYPNLLNKKEIGTRVWHGLKREDPGFDRAERTVREVVSKYLATSVQNR